MTTNQEIKAVHVWYDRDGAETYSVSLMGEDGEIQCEGGESSLRIASAWGRNLAREYMVPCEEYATSQSVELGRPTDRYVPLRTLRSVTDEQIEALRSEAIGAGDTTLERDCDRTLKLGKFTGAGRHRHSAKRVLAAMRYADAQR